MHIPFLLSFVLTAYTAKEIIHIHQNKLKCPNLGVLMFTTDSGGIVVNIPKEEKEYVCYREILYYIAIR